VVVIFSVEVGTVRVLFFVLVHVCLGGGGGCDGFVLGVVVRC
jgi:hypothetical protein